MVKTDSQSCHHGDPQGVCPQFPAPKESEFPWLQQCERSTWWEELGAVPGIKDRHKFTWKIRVSFYVPEVCLRVSWNGFTLHLQPPQVLDRGAFHPEKFAYQDVRQRPVLLTIAYARCLQYWVEKHNLLKIPDFCPWGECVRELRQTVWEFVNITYRDVMQGLEIEKSEASHLGATIFSQVLASPVNELIIVEDPPIWILLLPKMKLSGVPLHPRDLSRVIDTC